jgi:hypothetical protein
MEITAQMIFGSILFLAGLGGLIGGMIHEITWWKRRGWHLTTGVVTGHACHKKDGKVLYPIIQYETEIGSKSFISKYGGSKPPPFGADVKVAHHPEMIAEEHFTVSNRILFSLLFFSVGLVLTIAGALLIWTTSQAK